MPHLIIAGKEVPVPKLETDGFYPVRNFKDEPKLALRVGKSNNNDGRTRTRSVSQIILHTTKGIPGGSDKRPQILHKGKGPNTKAVDRTINYWSTDPTPSGAHIVIDQDCSIGCLADLAYVTAYHAGNSSINESSIGIEIYQGDDAGLYEEQLTAVVAVVNVLTAYFGIQRQVPSKYLNKPIKELDQGGGGLTGVFGHRDVSNNRGFGDPGDFIFQYLEHYGYDCFDFTTGEDRVIWKKRQERLNKEINAGLVVDGLPGPATRAALLKLGRKDGLYNDDKVLEIKNWLNRHFSSEEEILEFLRGVIT